MSVQSEITRLEAAKAAISQAITEKGVTVPTGTMLDAMAPLISAIEAGGGENLSDFPIKFSKVESGVLVLSSHTACTSHVIALRPDSGKIKEFMGCVYTPKYESDLSTTKLFFAIQYVDNVPQMTYTTKKDILAIGLTASVRTNGNASTSICGAHYDADGNAIPFSSSSYMSKYAINIHTKVVDNVNKEGFAVKSTGTYAPYYAAGCEYHWVIFYNEVD